MINRITAFSDSEGNTYGTLEAAQKAEMELLMRNTDCAQDQSWTTQEIADWSIKNKDKIVDILTTKPNSLTKARKVNGGTKTRAKKSTRHEAEQFPLPMEDQPQPAA